MSQTIDLLKNTSFETKMNSLIAAISNSGNVTSVNGQTGDVILNSQSVGALSDDTVIPIKLSDLANDQGFITCTVDNLTNYYSKTSTYTKSEVNSLLNNVSSVNFEVVSVLPTEDIATNTIYLVPSSSQLTNNIYDEYINLDGTYSGWECIGSTSVDLSNYYNKSEVDGLITVIDEKVGETISQAEYDALTVEEKNSGVYYIYDAEGVSSSDILYDNTSSGLEANNMKDAIDEVNEKFNVIEDLPIQTFITESEFNAWLDGYSSNISESTIYEACAFMSNSPAHSVLGFGQFHLYGKKRNNVYEYQEITGFSHTLNDGIHKWWRAKVNGVWSSWVKFAQVDTRLSNMPYSSNAQIVGNFVMVHVRQIPALSANGGTAVLCTMADTSINTDATTVIVGANAINYFLKLQIVNGAVTITNNGTVSANAGYYKGSTVLTRV